MFVWCSRTSLVNNKQCRSLNFDCLCIFYISLLYSVSVISFDVLVLAFSHLGGHQLCMQLNLNRSFLYDCARSFSWIPVKNCVRFALLGRLKAVAVNSAPGCKPPKAAFGRICPITFPDQYLELCIIFPSAFLFLYFLKQLVVSCQWPRKQ